MRQLSIRTQVLLALNGTTLVLGLAAGWACIHLVSRAAERRAVHEPAHNAALLIAALRLPLTERLALDIRRLTGCETAFVQATGSLVASTLPELTASAAAAALPALGDQPVRVSLGGRQYAAGISAIPGARPPTRVLLLAPGDVLKAEGRRAGGRIAWITLSVVLLTTAAGVWLAHGVTRALRRLAAEAARMTAGLAAAPAAANAADSLAAPSAVDGQVGRGCHYPTPAASSARDRQSPRAAKQNGNISSTASAPPACQPPPGSAGPGCPLRFAETAAPAEVASLARSFNQLLTRLQSAQQQLEHAARLAAVGQLASAVVHELRNPLCGIAMNARILADEAARRGERDPSLDLIAREVERMDLYLQELLLLARPASGPAAPAPATPANRPAASLRAVCESVAALLAGRCRHAGVEWTTRLPDADLLIAIPADALRQVLLNLALNALDAMPAGGRLAVAASPAAAGRLRLTVSDTGGGVQPPPGQDVFAPFVSTKAGGSGLGLYISRQIAERNGGQIGFTPESPQGTTFWVELPLARSP